MPRGRGRPAKQTPERVAAQALGDAIVPSQDKLRAASTVAADVRDEIDDILRDVPGGDAKLTISREIDNRSGTWAWCLTRAAQGFQIGELREKFGPGHYALLFRDTRSNRIITTRRLWIAAENTNGDGGTPAPVAAGPVVEAGVKEMVTMDKLIAVLLERALQPPPDPTATIAALMAALAPFVQQRTDPVDVGVRIAEMVKRGSSEGSTGELVGALRAVMGLADEIGGRAPAESDPWSGVLRSLAPPIVEALTRGASAPPVPNVPPGMLPATALPLSPDAPVVIPRTPETPPVDTSKGLLGQLGPLIPNLVKWANRQADPQLRADFVLDEVPPWMYDLIVKEVGAMTEAEFLASAFAQYPQLEAIRPWTEHFLRAVRAAVAEDAQLAAGEGEGDVDFSAGADDAD